MALDGRGMDIRQTMALAEEAQRAALEGDEARASAIRTRIRGAPGEAFAAIAAAGQAREALAAGDADAAESAARLMSQNLAPSVRAQAATLRGQAVLPLLGRVPGWTPYVLGAAVGALVLGAVWWALLRGPRRANQPSDRRRR